MKTLKNFSETVIEENFFVIESKNHSIDTKEVSKDIDKSFIQFHFQIKGDSTFVFNQGNYKMNLSKEKYADSVIQNEKKKEKLKYERKCSEKLERKEKKS